MYLSSSVGPFAASWLLLLLCPINPLYGAIERSHQIPRGVDETARHQSRSARSAETVPFGGQYGSNNVPRSPSYNTNRHYDSVMRPRLLSEDTYPVVYPAKQSVAKKFTPDEPSVDKKSYYDHALPLYVEKDGKEESDRHASRSDRRNTEERRRKDEEIIKRMSMLDKILSEDSDESDVELKKNTIEDSIMIGETCIPEETKRVVRQVRRQRPGFFWTLARLAFETFNDTRSAVQQISNIINENVIPDTSARPTARSNSLMVAGTKSTTASNDQSNMSSNLANVNATTTTTTAMTTTPTTTTTSSMTTASTMTTAPTMTTTAPTMTTTTMRTTTEPFRLTRSGLQDIIRRNLRGLVRLFNVEWQDALNQSDVTVREFQRDLGNQVGGFLRDNPAAF